MISRRVSWLAAPNGMVEITWNLIHFMEKFLK